MNEHKDTALRRTGRTSRMIDHAIDRALWGKYVTMYCDTAHGAKKLSRRIISVLAERKIISGILMDGLKIKIGDGCITSERIGPQFDWNSMRSFGVHPSVVSLVDHRAIEQRFPEIVNMLYQFIAVSKEKHNEDRQD